MTTIANTSARSGWARRLRVMIQCDLRLQLRNGFYYASALVVVASVLILRWLPPDLMAWLLPVIILQNIMTNTFYFVAGLILLEKGEGTMEAKIVTPLRVSEYVWSKAITLGLLSVVESLLVCVLCYGWTLNFGCLVPGIILLTLLFTLLGAIVVVRYASINEFILPSVFYTSVLAIPLVDHFGLWETPLMLVHPVQGPLLLLAGAFEPLSPTLMAFSIVYPLVWILVLFPWCTRAVRAGITRVVGAS